MPSGIRSAGLLAERLDVAGVGEREHGGVLAAARGDDHDVGGVAALQLGAQRQAVVVRRQRLGLDLDAGLLRSTSSASCWNGLSVAPLALPKVKVKLSAASPELLGAAAVVATTGGEREGADRRDGDERAEAAEPPVAVLGHGAAFRDVSGDGAGEDGG